MTIFYRSLFLSKGNKNNVHWWLSFTVEALRSAVRSLKITQLSNDLLYNNCILWNVTFFGCLPVFFLLNSVLERLK